MKQNSNNNIDYEDILAIDYGLKRTGVARISTFVRISEPLAVIPTDDTIYDAIMELCKLYESTAVVVGLPRSLAGQDTSQTKLSRVFAHELAGRLRIPVHMIDEAGTTAQAREKIGEGVAVDAHAAAIIAEDFIAFRDKDSLLIAKYKNKGN